MSDDHNLDGEGRWRRFGGMKVIATSQATGRLYECECGWCGWSAWGHAARHAADCLKAQTMRDAEGR